MKWRQLTIRSLFFATTGVAIFCAGYRLGLQNSRDNEFDALFTSSGSTTIGNGFTVCSLEIVNDHGSENPLAPVANDTIPVDDPFATAGEWSSP